MALVEEEVFKCGVCEKRCKSKAGLVVHRRRMHEESAKKKKFVCEGCGEDFRQEANKLNHQKVCGGPGNTSERRVCACGRDFAKSYIARHRKKCAPAIAAAAQEEIRLPRVYKAKRFVCECGREMAKSNRARHKREACPYGDAGP